MRKHSAWVMLLILALVAPAVFADPVSVGDYI